MYKANSIIMCAPKMTIFETAANLKLWPQILPHYRYIRYLEESPSRNVVVMAATRSGIPISWTSEQVIDHDLAFRIKILAPIADKIIGDFFIYHIANKTLRSMKSYIEANTNKVTA